MLFNNYIFSRIVCYFVFILSLPGIIWSSDQQETAYGDGWFYYISDNGTNHIMNFSSIPNDTKDMYFGDAYFYLYTRNNMDKPETITIPENDLPFESYYFNKSNDIRVITHGWLTAESVRWLQNIKLSLLKAFDLNVITVDWSELSKNVIYPFAAFSTRYVGKRIAKLLNVLMETFDVSSKNVHLIGHSLGAHVMGYAGMFSSVQLFRITGLDPARPLFEIPEISPDYRLDKSDADFVDILHTCGGVYGYMNSYGHADFYPNGGKPSQPGCRGVRQVADSCSHSRSYEYFDESIEYTNDNGFISYPCESWEKFENGECNQNSTSMGYHASAENEGNYYLHTRNESKFAKNNYTWEKKTKIGNSSLSKLYLCKKMLQIA